MARYCQIVYAFLMFLLAAPPQMLLAEKPSLVDGELVVNIDAATNRGGTEFHLRNDTNRPMSIVLHVGKFVLQTTGRTIPATVAFERGASEKAGPFLEAKLEPEDVLFIRLEVSGFGEAGEAHAILFDRGTSLAVVKAVKFNVPFAVSLITTDADNPELTFKQGKTGLLVLKNADPMTYPVNWSLLVSDTSTVLGQSTTVLPGHSTIPIDFNVPSYAFPSWFFGLFKDRKQDGQLVLRFAPQGDIGCPAPPTKTIPVKIKTRFWPAWVPNFSSNILVFLTLLLGGLCSMFLNLWIPHKLQRIGLIDRMEGLRRKTQMISTKIDSVLRVKLRVERLRLAELIEQVGCFNADASSIFEGYRRDIGLLDRQINLVKELDEVTEIWENLRGKSADAPPAVLDNVGKQLAEVTEVLKLPMPEQVDLQRVQELIRGAKDRLRKTTCEDPQLAEQLSVLVDELERDYKEDGPIGLLPKCQQLRNQLAGLFDLFKNADYKEKSNIRPGHYHWLSSVVERLCVLRHYIREWENASTDLKNFVKKYEESLLRCLRSRTWNTLHYARQLRWEFQEGILPTAIEEELAKKNVFIDMVPIKPLPNQSVKLEVHFKVRDLDTSTARQEFTCVWDFGAIGKEEGWTIWHYFRNKDETHFTVSFRGSDGQEIRECNGGGAATVPTNVCLRENGKRRRNDRRRLEWIKFAIAFGVALLALVAGAKEKLMALDLFTALTGVFLIGFGVDTVKNLITKRSQG